MEHAIIEDGKASQKRHQVSAKGVLALITGPSRNVPSSEGYTLEYYGHNTSLNLDEEGCSHTSKGVEPTAVKFNPNEAEFTLLFFCDYETCRNSRRIAPIVGNFMQEVNSFDGKGQISSKNPIHLICVPNDDLRGKVFAEMSQLTDYSCIGFSHRNRLHVIR